MLMRLVLMVDASWNSHVCSQQRNTFRGPCSNIDVQWIQTNTVPCVDFQKTQAQSRMKLKKTIQWTSLLYKKTCLDVHPNGIGWACLLATSWADCSLYMPNETMFTYESVLGENTFAIPSDELMTVQLGCSQHGSFLFSCNWPLWNCRNDPRSLQKVPRKQHSHVHWSFSI